MHEWVLENYLSTDDSRVIVVSEIGNNHNGSVERAKQLIKASKEAGADFVKFQMRNLSKIYRDSESGDANDLGAEYVIDLLAKYNLSISQHESLKNYAEEIGISYLCTPWDVISAEILVDWGLKVFKIASADFTNLPLLQFFKPYRDSIHLILSTGMTTTDEIDRVVAMLKDWGIRYSLLHTNSSYPAPYSDLQLRYIHELKSKSEIVGYSGHERGYATTFAAIGMGARIIERHITLDKTLEGPDHLASLNPVEFADMVNGIREISAAMGGQTSIRMVSQGERLNRETLGKSVVAARHIEKGAVAEFEDFEVKSPGRGVSPLMLPNLVGKKMYRAIARGDFLYQSDVDQNSNSERERYIPELPFKTGIPVRFHDYPLFVERFDVDFVEFHLSYKDIENFDISNVPTYFDVEFLVHAPELFSESHLLDLTNPENEYREASINHLQGIIDLTRTLMGKFPSQSVKPGVIVNCGGFSANAPLEPEFVAERFELLQKSFRRLDASEISILPQTMAPFPWLLGGQQHQNLFLHPKQIADYCEELGTKVCFDTSHSALACNRFGHKLKDYVEILGDRIGHIHIGDAAGLTGEGLQIDEGDIDFSELVNLLMENCQSATLLPEIWQGHKDFGSGFKAAFQRLQAYVGN